MAVSIVRLGTERAKDEGMRIGTVHRPPRGVPKSEYASRNWYDVWFPNLAPRIETIKLAQNAKTPAQWAAFAKKYRAEWRLPKTGTLSSCWPRCLIRPIFPSGATVRMRPSAIVRYYASYLPKRGLNCGFERFECCYVLY